MSYHNFSFIFFMRKMLKFKLLEKNKIRDSGYLYASPMLRLFFWLAIARIAGKPCLYVP